MPIVGLATAPITISSGPKNLVPPRGLVAQWVMIFCAEILSALSNVEKVGHDPLLMAY